MQQVAEVEAKGKKYWLTNWWVTDFSDLIWGPSFLLELRIVQQACLEIVFWHSKNFSLKSENQCSNFNPLTNFASCLCLRGEASKGNLRAYYCEILDKPTFIGMDIRELSFYLLYFLAEFKSLGL